MPVLVLTVPEDFYKLFQNRGLATVTSLRKSCRVVIVTVDIALVLVIAVLGAKNSRADGTGKVFDVVFPIESSNVRTAKCTATLVTEEIKSPEIVGLTQWILVWRLVRNRKEFRGDNFAAVLQSC